MNGPRIYDFNKKMQALVLLICFMMFSLSSNAQTTTPTHTIQLTNIQPNSNEKLTFFFQHINVRTLLQLIAKSSGLNFIINDHVKGEITLNLKNVTWAEALEIVLKTQGLASRRVGNVIYISTIEDITANEAKQMKSEDAIANLAPLKSELIRLKYTSATDIATLLKGSESNLLTARGQAAVDTRTNSLIIRDTPESIKNLIPEIKKLDIPAKQVLIEARIVNVDVTSEEQLGVRFGLSDSRHLSGSLAGANIIASGTNPSNMAQEDLTKRLNFNVPATALFDGANPASVGLALARVGRVLLDLELSALEGERKAEVIARPRVITSNQQKASIQTGEEIPYQEATSSGATSVVFKKAVLSLEITPQITPDNKIVLKIIATEDTRGANTAIGSSGGVPLSIPAINTQAVESNILLNNNETIAIGGVYRIIKNNTYDRVPFLSKLPIVGHLFKYEGTRNEKHELIVFVTPRIIKSAKANTKIAANVKS